MLNSFISKTTSFNRSCGKNLYSRAGHRWQYGTCALHAGYPGLRKLSRTV